MNPLYLVAIVVISIMYAWTFYNVPILLVGIRRLHRNRNRKSKPSVYPKSELPSISLIVPVKNEENVIGRLLNALLNIDYPKEKKEIVVVEDGSVDQSLEICRSFEIKYPHQVKVICRDVSDGKPSALMAALKHVKGDIIGVFDADNVPEPDALLLVADYFRNSSVVALQGRVCAINAEENMLTQAFAHEETVRYEGFMGGKEACGLFVPLNGSCYFIRRAVLEDVGGWDTTALSEDMELAARLVHNGYRVNYASDVRSWQEYPASVIGFFKQRVRWFRGTMEVGLKYGKLLKNLNTLSLDAEVTMAGSFIVISCLLGYLIAFLSFMVPLNPDFVSLFLANVTSVLSVVLLALAGVAMVYTTKQQKLRSLLWIPFLYLYWIAQNFIALYALLQILLGRPKTWLKTEKNGVIANSTYVSKREQVFA